MFSGIKKKLTLSFVFASIVPLLIFSSILLYTEYTVQKKQTLLLQEEKTIRVSQQIKGYFFSLEKEINFLFSITPFISSTTQVKEQFLSKLISKENQFERLTLVDKNGLELFFYDRTIPFFENKAPKQSNKTLTNQAIKENKTIYGKLYFHDKNHEPLIDVVFLIKDIKTGLLKNMLIAQVRFKKVWQIVSNTSKLDGEEAMLTNTKGLIVAHKNPSVIIKKTHIPNVNKKGFVKNRNNTWVLKSVNEFTIQNKSFNVIVQQHIYDALSLSFNTFILAMGLIILLLLQMA